jgi:hypothetical protein
MRKKPKPGRHASLVVTARAVSRAAKAVRTVVNHAVAAAEAVAGAANAAVRDSNASVSTWMATL